jgi:urease accessory protein
MILERIVPPPVDLAKRKIERVVLASAELAKHRQRVMTDAGREVGIALPHGATLRDGDVLHLDESVAIVVHQAEEELLRLLPRTPEEFALAGYHVGNLHRAAMIEDRAVTVLYDKAIESLAERIRIPCEKVRGKFRPVQNSGHSH